MYAMTAQPMCHKDDMEDMPIAHMRMERLNNLPSEVFTNLAMLTNMTVD